MPAFVSSRPARFAGLFVLTLLPGLMVTVRAETKPFELNMERVKIVDPKGLASPTYFVPGVNLIVTCAGDVWAQSKKGGSNAQAHGRFYVKGFEKALLQDLARQARDELAVGRERARADLHDQASCAGELVSGVHGPLRYHAPAGREALPVARREAYL